MVAPGFHAVPRQRLRRKSTLGLSELEADPRLAAALWTGLDDSEAESDPCLEEDFQGH